MGNTSCKFVMKNDLRNESTLYKNRKLLYFVTTICGWYFYIQHHYDGVEKWYIMPIAAYVTTNIILGILIHIITEFSMNQYDLNNKIFKCIQWQQYNQPTCSKKRLNKCIINADDVNTWELPKPQPKPQPQPVYSNNIKEPFNQFMQPVISSGYTKTNYPDIKPMNYFPN